MAEKTKVKRQVLERDGSRCRYCGRPVARWPEFAQAPPGTGYLNFDHVVPKSRGGGYTVENIVVSCADCNAEKYDRTPEEWREAGLTVKEA